MIWPYLWGMSAALVLASAITGRGKIAAVMIALAYLATRLADVSMSRPVDDLAIAAIWVGAGVIVSRTSPSVAALLVASGLCNLAGRAVWADVVVGSWPYVAADGFAIAAMCMVGAQIGGGNRYGGHNLGLLDRGRVLGDRGGSSVASRKAQ